MHNSKNTIDMNPRRYLSPKKERENAVLNKLSTSAIRARTQGETMNRLHQSLALFQQKNWKEKGERFAVRERKPCMVEAWVRGLINPDSGN
jgi:hypothetical protein